MHRPRNKFNTMLYDKSRDDNLKTFPPGINGQGDDCWRGTNLEFNDSCSREGEEKNFEGTCQAGFIIG